MGSSGGLGGDHPHLQQARCTSWVKGTGARSSDFLDNPIAINLDNNYTMMFSRRNRILENLRLICALILIRNLLKSKKGIIRLTRAIVSFPRTALDLSTKKVKGMKDS